MASHLRNGRRASPTREVWEQPAYPLAEAARYVKLPLATLHSWVVGRSYPTAKGVGRFQPLIHPPSRKPPVLSFSNLIEAHVLRALRSEHGVSLKAVRQALHYAERTLGVQRLLLRRELCSEGGELFLERYGELVSLTASGQLAMRKIFEQHLARVVWNVPEIPVRLYPFLASEAPAPDRPIAIDPQIAFGRPVVASRGISTHVIAERIDAGETVAALADDYDLSPHEIEQAVLYEHAA
jgi:uncharacterized protein (DUF433 family)